MNALHIHRSDAEFGAFYANDADFALDVTCSWDDPDRTVGCPGGWSVDVEIINLQFGGLQISRSDLIKAESKAHGPENNENKEQSTRTTEMKRSGCSPVS